MAQELEGNFSFQSSWRQTYFQAKLILQGVATSQKVGLSEIHSVAAPGALSPVLSRQSQTLEGMCQAIVCTSPAASSLYTTCQRPLVKCASVIMITSKSKSCRLLA